MSTYKCFSFSSLKRNAGVPNVIRTRNSLRLFLDHLYIENRQVEAEEGVEHPAELRLIADRSLEGGVGRQVNC